MDSLLSVILQCHKRCDRSKYLACNEWDERASLENLMTEGSYFVET